ncbi:MAG: hypothetical protein MAG795_00416 [Candidatus Woesearchaeota archaeon]|nr:hypothetical protein [Candidatus Woesearchaeota archaeon]
MIHKHIGPGDYNFTINRELTPKQIGENPPELIQSSLKISGGTNLGYGEHKSGGNLQYILTKDPILLDNQQIHPLTLFRLAPKTKIAIDPHPNMQTGLAEQGETDPIPFRYIMFEPSQEPNNIEFEALKLYLFSDTNTGWFCGDWTEQDIGIVPLEIAYGFFGSAYLNDPERQMPHYHKSSLEGYFPENMLRIRVQKTQKPEVNNVEYSLEGDTHPSFLTNYDFSDPRDTNMGPEGFFGILPGEIHKEIAVENGLNCRLVTIKFPGCIDDKVQAEFVPKSLA